MHVIVHIQDKSYIISCGKGQQDLVWLALAACYRYGREAYPKGNYVPCQLLIDGYSPNPRISINEHFEDNKDNQAVVIIKDANKVMNEDQKLWYDCAFGLRRYMMQTFITYIPTQRWSKRMQESSLTKIVKLEYKIFEELKHMFDKNKYNGVIEVEVNPTDIEAKKLEGYCEIPYSSIEKHSVLVYQTTVNEEGQEETRSQVIEGEEKAVGWTFTPKPISKQEREEMEKKEDEEQKKQDAEERARLLAEQEEAEKRLQAEEPKLGIPNFENIFSNIQIGDLLEQEELMEQIQNVISHHYVQLYHLFSFYANLHISNQPDQEIITGQDFMHFLKTFDFVVDTAMLYDVLGSLAQQGVLANALQDSLSVENGLSFDKFLEAIIRYGLHRTSPQELSSFLELMIKDNVFRAKQLFNEDTFKSELMKPEISDLFQDNSEHLSRLFMNNATIKVESQYEMTQQDFINILQQAELLGEVVTQEQAKQIYDDTVQFTSMNDFDNMFYVDFLESLVRLAEIVPFDEEEIQKVMEENPDIQLLPEKVHSIIRVLCGPATRTPSSTVSRGQLTTGKRKNRHDQS